MKGNKGNVSSGGSKGILPPEGSKGMLSETSKDLLSVSMSGTESLDDVGVQIPEPHEETLVLMPLDSNQHSLYALQYYINHIHKPGNKVYVLYVSEEYLNNRSAGDGDGRDKQRKGCCSKIFDKFVVDVGPSPGMLAEWQAQDKQNYHRVRHRAKYIFRANDVDFEVQRICAKNKEPHEIIIDFRKEIGADLIVMGTRGLGAIKRRVFGSVSDKVMQNCIVPVLIVKVPESTITVLNAEVELPRESAVDPLPKQFKKVHDAKSKSSTFT